MEHHIFRLDETDFCPNWQIRTILTRIKKVRQMGSIHPTDFIIYDFNKKRLQFEGLFQRSPVSSPFFIE